MLNCLDRDGFAIVPAVLEPPAVEELAREMEAQLPDSCSAGVRGLAKRVGSVRELARSAPIRSLVEPVLASGAKLVRSALFHKSKKANRQVAWHQDLVIAVQERFEVEGYTSWSMKEGVPHVQPPIEILERMLGVRLHLDAADESNGALWVSPGSHRLGRIAEQEAAGVAERGGRRLCVVDAGDVLLFRPLILHASRKVTSDRPRRVIHLEYAGVTLPEPLRWAGSA
jgi:ectoine hydroxylase-related dioxygenase (phytanoyl-CoA dioxygenase family)